MLCVIINVYDARGAKPHHIKMNLIQSMKTGGTELTSASSSSTEIGGGGVKSSTNGHIKPPVVTTSPLKPYKVVVTTHHSVNGFHDLKKSTEPKKAVITATSAAVKHQTPLSSIKTSTNQANKPLPSASASTSVTPSASNSQTSTPVKKMSELSIKSATSPKLVSSVSEKLNKLVGGKLAPASPVKNKEDSITKQTNNSSSVTSIINKPVGTQSSSGISSSSVPIKKEPTTSKASKSETSINGCNGNIAVVTNLTNKKKSILLDKKCKAQSDLLFFSFFSLFMHHLSYLFCYRDKLNWTK